MQNLQLTKLSLYKFNGYEKNQLNEKCLGYLNLTKLYEKLYDKKSLSPI